MNMNEAATVNAPAWLRIVALLAIIWNLIGVYFCFVLMGAIGRTAGVHAMPTTPVWVHAACLVSVIAGLLGGVALLLLKRQATPSFVVSVIAYLVHEGWVSFMSGTPTFAMSTIVILIAIVFASIANNGTKKGWLS